MAISPQYRFAPKDTFPAQVHDVKAAVRWLRAHKDEYKVDPDHDRRRRLLGRRAPLADARADRAGRRPGGGRPQATPPARRSRPSSTTSARPTSWRRTSPTVTRPIVKDFLGGSPAEKPEAAKKASPLTFVTTDDAPILTFQGTKDPLVPHTQAEKLADAMTKAGVPGRVELLIGKGHGWGDPEMRHTLAETFAFFDRYLKPAKTP